MYLKIERGVFRGRRAGERRFGLSEMSSAELFLTVGVYRVWGASE